MRRHWAGSPAQRARAELRTRVQQAQALTRGLSELKGAVMKAGQLLSIDASDVLPPEATEILSKLQGQAEPVRFETMQRVLHAELGAERVALLQDLNETAAAAASIGQVHRARVNGADVAVKIQYPNIAESIDSDMATMQKLADAWLALTRRPIDVSGTFEELRQVLHAEADYVQERKSLERFGVLLANDHRFIVPRSFPHLSSKRVLTMSWEHGVPLGQWIASQPSPEQRHDFARSMLDLYCREFFEWGLVQTDPNFGNFLVRPSTGQLVLLDFGATVTYDNDFRQAYAALLRTIADADASATLRAGISFGLLDPRESDETKKYFLAMLHNAMEPFRPSAQPFEFRSEDYSERARSIVRSFVSSLRYSAPPRHLIFLHRKLGGIFQLLRRLDVRMDLVPYWQRMLEQPSPGLTLPPPPSSRMPLDAAPSAIGAA